MAGKYLMDTNSVIDYLDNKLPKSAAKKLDAEQLEISVITRMELLAWRNADAGQLAVLYCTRDKTVNDFIRSRRFLRRPVPISGVKSDGSGR